MNLLLISDWQDAVILVDWWKNVVADVSSKTGKQQSYVKVVTAVNSPIQARLCAVTDFADDVGTMFLESWARKPLLYDAVHYTVMSLILSLYPEKAGVIEDTMSLNQLLRLVPCKDANWQEPDMALLNKVRSRWHLLKELYIERNHEIVIDTYMPDEKILKAAIAEAYELAQSEADSQVAQALWEQVEEFITDSTPF